MTGEEFFSELMGEVMKGECMRLISDEEQIEQLEFTEVAVQWVEHEGRWRRTGNDFKAGEKANELNSKLWRMFSRGDWADRRTMAQAFDRLRLKMLYHHKGET